MSSVNKIFKQAIQTEIDAVHQLLSQVPDDLDNVVEAILQCRGKVIVTGMGKSGQIGRKIAATLASTGTPSFFMHPAEAYHGDLGMISAADVVIAISNSGETEEVLQLIPFLENQENTLIAFTGGARSTLAQHARFVFDVAVPAEACPLQLAPTSSTTATLVIGDALAVTLMEMRRFSPENFAAFHPGGSLGRKLLTTVEMVMKDTDLPQVEERASMVAVVNAISSGRLGLAVVIDPQSTVIGIITDGDLRRTLESSQQSFFALTAGEVMTSAPKVIAADTKLTEAEAIMAEAKINSLLVTEAGKLRGVVQIYDL